MCSVCPYFQYWTNFVTFSALIVVEHCRAIFLPSSQKSKRQRQRWSSSAINLLHRAMGAQFHNPSQLLKNQALFTSLVFFPGHYMRLCGILGWGKLRSCRSVLSFFSALETAAVLAVLLQIKNQEKKNNFHQSFRGNFCWVVPPCWSGLQIRNENNKKTSPQVKCNEPPFFITFFSSQFSRS